MTIKKKGRCEMPCLDFRPCVTGCGCEVVVLSFQVHVYVFTSSSPVAGFSHDMTHAL